MSRLPSRGSNPLIAAGIAVILILIVVGCGVSVYGLVNKDHVRITVRDKQTKVSCSDGDCKDKYLIYTDHGVYEDTDNLLQLKFNSSDLYGDLQEGHTYDCTVVGFRLPFFSSYKNLLSCEEVEAG